MDIRRFIIAVVLCSLPSCLATAGEPVVKGSLRSVDILGRDCLSVVKTDSYLRPGTRLQLRACQGSPDQIFEWNVVTFQITFHELYMGHLAHRRGEHRSPAIRLAYGIVQQTPHQKWFPHHKNETWSDAFQHRWRRRVNSAELCLTIGDDQRREWRAVDAAELRWRRLSVVPH